MSMCIHRTTRETITTATETRGMDTRRTREGGPVWTLSEPHTTNKRTSSAITVHAELYTKLRRAVITLIYNNDARWILTTVINVIFSKRFAVRNKAG